MTWTLVGSSPKHPTSRRQPTGDALHSLLQLWLLERDAQRLRCDARRRAFILSSLAEVGKALLPTLILHPFLPILVFATTPGGQYQIVQFKVGHKVLPFCNLHQMSVPEFLCLLEHLVLNLLQFLLHDIRQLIHSDICLLAVVPHHHPCLPLLQIPGSHLDPDRHALLLPVCILPPRIVDRSIVELHPHALVVQRLTDGFAKAREFFEGALLRNDGHDDHLLRRHAGRQDQPRVVPVDHDHDPDGTRGETPARLPHHLCLPILVLVVDVEHLTEVLAQVMRGGALDGTSGDGNVPLNGGGGVSPRELLLLRLRPRNDGDGE
mmetsp:Transcript_31152/g.57012  ORF Transcript_31152/g.57012 Transcript_31152/m.57012 type:complete len:321 (+) Transcript_31152:240-1202(+)